MRKKPNLVPRTRRVSGSSGAAPGRKKLCFGQRGRPEAICRANLQERTQILARVFGQNIGHCLGHFFAPVLRKET